MSSHRSGLMKYKIISKTSLFAIIWIAICYLISGCSNFWIVKEQGFTEGISLIKSLDRAVIVHKDLSTYKTPFNTLSETISEGCIVFKKNDSYGYVDYKGNIVIEAKFHKAEKFIRGRAFVKIIKDNTLYGGYINKKATFVFGPKKYFDGTSKSGLLRYRIPEKSMLGKYQSSYKFVWRDKKGKLIYSAPYAPSHSTTTWKFKAKKYYTGRNNDDGKCIRLFSFSKDRKRHIFYVNSKGRESNKFHRGSLFRNNCAYVADKRHGSKNRQCYILDDQFNQNKIVPGMNAYAVFYEGLSAYYDYKTNKRGFINQKGEIAIKPQFGEAHFFSDKLAAVKRDSKGEFCSEYFYIDKSGNKAFTSEYKITNAGKFINGIARVAIEGKKHMRIWGYMTKEGKFIKKLSAEQYYRYNQGKIKLTGTSNNMDMGGSVYFISPYGKKEKLETVWDAMEVYSVSAAPFRYTWGFIRTILWLMSSPKM